MSGPFCWRVSSDVGGSEGKDNKQKKDFPRESFVVKVINFNFIALELFWCGEAVQPPLGNMMLALRNEPFSGPSSMQALINFSRILF